MLSNCEGKRVDDAIKNTVTSQDLAIVARQILEDTDAQVLEHDLGPYSPDRLGFLGSHRQLKIKIKRKNQDHAETYNLFVKSVPYDCQRQVSFINDEGIFEEEYIFFSKIVPVLLENYKCEKWGPRCYLSKADSFIMEDLRCQGYKLRASLFDSSEEVKSVLAAVARLHGCSIIAETRLNQSSKKFQTLKELYPNSFEEKIFKRQGQGYRWFTIGSKIAYAIGARIGHDEAKLRKGFDQLIEIVKPSKVHRNVLCHGDLWTNNVMFDDSKPSPKCVLVDYQVLRYAPPALDILMVLYLHTSREFRNAHEKELVAYYYSVLEEVIRKSDLAAEVKVLTLQEISAALKDLRIFGPAVACLWFPVVLMDPEILKEKTKDSDGFDSFLFGDRVDITMSHYDKSEYYRNKLNEVVDELGEISNKL